MATDRMTLPEHVRNAMVERDADLLRQGVLGLARAIMEVEVPGLTGASHGEGSPGTRLTCRNGYRERRWDTSVGTIDLPIPRVRDGSHFASPLEPRRRAEKALLSVVQEAYVAGVSTRRVEEIVAALGVTGTEGRLERLVERISVHAGEGRGGSLRSASRQGASATSSHLCRRAAAARERRPGSS